MDGHTHPMPGPLGQIIRQCRSAAFHRLVGVSPAVIRVVAGEKRIRWDGGQLCAGPGAIILFPENLAVTVENIPPRAGVYQARALPLPRDRIEAAYARLDPDLRRREAAPLACATLPGKDADLLFDALFAAGHKLPPAVLALRQEELVLWLAEAGALLVPPAPQRLSDRLRRLLAERPDADWTADKAARALATSAPTLRRRLASEGGGFSALLQDVRMTQALALLQSGDLTVAAVAAAVGYDSPSRFAVRFRARFGAAPNEILRKSGED